MVEKKDIIEDSKLSKKVKISILCEIYGNLLTENQLDILDDYYNNDLSLGEIAENNNISRQGVRDLIKRAEIKLLDYEKKLGFMEKKKKNEKHLNIAIEKIDSLEELVSDKKELQKLKDIKVQLNKINL